MKKAILLSSALLALLATSAMAQGLNLSWGTCAVSAATIEAGYDCSAPDGSMDFLLNATFTAPPTGAPRVAGVDVVVDLQAAGASLPGWWDFNGPCRQGVIAAAFGRPSTGCGTARNYFATAAGGIAAIRTSTTENPTPSANRERIVLSYGIASSNVAALTPNQLVYGFGLAINSAENGGAGPACGGCTTPVDIVLNSMLLGADDGSGDFLVTGSATRQCVTWNGGLGGTNCTQATPTRNRTWGQVKSLYR